MHDDGSLNVWLFFGSLTSEYIILQVFCYWQAFKLNVSYLKNLNGMNMTIKSSCNLISNLFDVWNCVLVSVYKYNFVSGLLFV
jgi:hypothetical protein